MGREDQGEGGEETGGRGDQGGGEQTRGRGGEEGNDKHFFYQCPCYQSLLYQRPTLTPSRLPTTSFN